jgi:hypothetical protein
LKKGGYIRDGEVENKWSPLGRRNYSIIPGGVRHNLKNGENE